MTEGHWIDHLEEVVRDVEAPPPPSRRMAVFGSSVTIHLVVLGLILIAQVSVKQKPPKDLPTFPLVFEEPVPVQPKPHPPIVMPHFVPVPRPAPPAPTEPAVPQQPKPPDDRSLLGFSGHGEKQGINERPPGPKGEKLSPEKPGPKGEGEKDAGIETRPEKNAQQEKLPPPPGPPDARTGAIPGPEPLNEGADGTPRPAPGGGSDDLPPRPQRLPGTFRVQEDREGRPGMPGTGHDFNVGGGGGMFGDISFEDGDYPWNDYSIKVYFAVYRSWLRELYGRVSRFERDQLLHHLPTLDGECAIRFVIHRDGSVDQLQVVWPSVISALDESSSAALLRAVLPALPADFPRNQERVTFKFRIDGFQTAQQLKFQLDMARENGDF